MHSTANRKLNIPHVSTQAKLARVFPSLQSGNLLSLGQLLDDHKDNTATFTKHDVRISQNNKTIATGYRNPSTHGMWHINLHANQMANTIIHKQTTKTQLASYLHAACFSPATSTLLKAIQRGYFTTWPGLTVDLIRKHLPPQPATIKGHLDQEAQGLQSTAADNDAYTAHTDGEWHTVVQRTNNVMVDTITPQDKTYSDITGRFPHAS
jgi:hypothetical protein